MKLTLYALINSVLLNCAKCTKRRIIVIYNYMKTKIERVFFLIKISVNKVDKIFKKNFIKLL